LLWLDLNCPAEVYQPSTRVYQGLPDMTSLPRRPASSLIVAASVSATKVQLRHRTVFAGQTVGIKEVHDDIWLVSFMDYDLGYFDLETRVLEPLENPFGPKVLPMS
jgi:putative transposase